MVHRLVLYLVTCSSFGACSLCSLPCRRFPWGFSAFSVPGCLSFCWPGSVGWAATLPFFFLCFSCSGWLAGVRWVLHPVSGCSSWGCVCSLGGCVFTLLAFPYFRVGELLACGVYGVSSLRSLQSRLPFVVRPPFPVSVCPSPALGLGWFGHRSVAPPAAPVCWALLVSRLRRSVALASGRTLSFCFLAWVFFLGSLLGLGLVGCDPAWVPPFFWGALLPLSWFSLGGSCRLVVQAPGIFLESLLGFFPLASSVCCWLGVVKADPWLSTLRSLAVDVVTLVLCQVLVGLPSWGCSAAGFLGPVVFLVFKLGHLSQVGSVFSLSPRS